MRVSKAALTVTGISLLVAGVAVADPPRVASNVACAPLRVDPPHVRIATQGALELHAIGGSGNAVFALEGDPAGGRIEAGGGLRAGDRAASFTAVARDGLCGAEARAVVEVVGPFDVRPSHLTIAAGEHVDFVASGAIGAVEYTLLDPSTDAQLGDGGRFTAKTAGRAFHVLARDRATGREARMTVTIGAPDRLRPRAEILAVPAGGRIRLEWRGGSGSTEAPAVSGVAGGRVVSEGDATFFDAKDARRGLADVTVKDRVTHETARVRVLVGETLGAASLARGTQTSEGDMASGDVNGDGRPDLVVGHSERSKTGFEAGGILVYYGKEDGTFAEPPDAIEGDHAGDRYGSVLLVRDINGDGIDDVVAGVPDEDLGEAKRGSVAIYMGGKGGIVREADREHVLAGEAAMHRFGSAVVVADFHGDGSPDLVVSAPGARNPFAPACDGGRVYLFRNQGHGGAMLTMPSQTIDVRDTLSDDAEAPLACAPGSQGAGRALAVLDIDGDQILDLAVGAPLTSYPAPSKGHGAVLVFRGTGDGKFEDTPSWSIHTDGAIRGDGNFFGAGLDVANVAGKPALVVRSPSFARRGASGLGALWVFAQGSLGPRAAAQAPGSPRRVRNVTTARGVMIFAPDGSRGFGRSAAFADVDGQPGAEYIVGAAAPNAPGGLFAFSLADLTQPSARPIARLPLAANEMEGFRVAGLAPPRGSLLPSGLAVWAPWRTTTKGPFVGAIDFAPPGAGSLVDRWKAHKAIALPNFGASDRAGTSVFLAALDGGASPLAVVGAPGAHSPASPGHVAGERLRTGSAFVFAADPAQPIARASGERADAQVGGASMTVLDFDGDGRQDLAVADPAESWGGTLPAGLVDPDGCQPLDASGRPITVGTRGVVRVYSLVSGQLVERFRVTAPRESAHDDAPPRFAKTRTGFALAAADVNGDGLEDLVVGRPGFLGASGAEVVLGRKADPSGKILVACNVGTDGPMGATATPGATAAVPIHHGTVVAKLGDLDKDGCDEIALSMRGMVFPPKAGIAIAFGYDASGKHCGGHRTPFVLRLVPDDHPLANNVLGDAASRSDDLNDLRGAPTGMGAVLAQGSGDVTGDGVPDVVFRDLDLSVLDRRGPAVEILSGAYLASLCPNRACPPGRSGALWSDGDWRVVAVRGIPAAHRRIVPSNDVARGFGSSIALGDLTGDGIAEIAIGSSDDTDAGAFAGEVRVFRGGAATTTESALLGDPWMIAVGDIGERSGFGASTAVAPQKGASAAWLLVGAPSSSRRQSGGSVGAAYRWQIEGTR